MQKEGSLHSEPSFFYYLEAFGRKRFITPLFYTTRLGAWGHNSDRL